jgi:hypothetical protein
MDHIVYLDARAKELENLENGNKTMIVRGAMGRKLPYGKVMFQMFCILLKIKEMV